MPTQPFILIVIDMHTDKICPQQRNCVKKITSISSSSISKIQVQCFHFSLFVFLGVLLLLLLMLNECVDIWPHAIFGMNKKNEIVTPRIVRQRVKWLNGKTNPFNIHTQGKKDRPRSVSNVRYCHTLDIIYKIIPMPLTRSFDNISKHTISILASQRTNSLYHPNLEESRSVWNFTELSRRIRERIVYCEEIFKWQRIPLSFYVVVGYVGVPVNTREMWMGVSSHSDLRPYVSV